MNFELVSVAADDPQGQADAAPHDPRVRIESVDAFRDFVAVEYRRDGLPRVAIAKVPPNGLPADATPDDTLHELAFDEALFSAGVGANPDWEQPSLRIGYGSLRHAVDGDRRRRGIRRPHAAQAAARARRLRPRAVRAAREWATAAGWHGVPISLVYRHDLVTSGRPAPTLLYGYGSYEHAIDPGFGIPRLSLLDRGMVFAVAHVRGGGEMGRLWYEHGKKLHKKNTFTDFIAAAEHLVDSDITSPDHLVAQGGSAGGLLMGAVANLAPGSSRGSSPRCRSSTRSRRSSTRRCRSPSSSGTSGATRSTTPRCTRT